MGLPSTETQPDRHALVAACIAEMVNGLSLRELSDKHRVPHQTLRRWLISEVPEQYRDAQREGLLQRIVEADDQLDSATSHLGVSKAREKCRFARWDAERRLPGMFAQRHEITGAGGGPIQLDSLERARRFAYVQESIKRSQVIDVLPEEAEPLPEPIRAAQPRTTGPSFPSPFRK